MSTVRFEERGAGRFSVIGALNFESAPDLYHRSRAQFKNATQMLIDLSGVTQADSAGLALLIEWMRWARANNQQIGFENSPSQLLALARISDIDELLANAGEASASDVIAHDEAAKAGEVLTVDAGPVPLSPGDSTHS
jgi:phospholipid transport system transporter-binding protein